VRTWLLATVLAALAGCDFAAGEIAADPGDDDLGPYSECVTAADCILAATSCCGCPEYAMPDVGIADGCDAVPCPDPDPSNECPPLVAACDDGVCTTACQAVACELSCPSGFAQDAGGCLTCACADAAPTVECADDADCVQVPGDCCGCARGGADTAVPAGDAEAFGESLMCPADPGDAACPEVDVCDPLLAPRCETGRCVLSDGSRDEVPVDACGRPDLPPCPEGAVCVLNVDTEASMDGLGTCQPGP